MKTGGGRRGNDSCDRTSGTGAEVDVGEDGPDGSVVVGDGVDEVGPGDDGGGDDRAKTGSEAGDGTKGESGCGGGGERVGMIEEGGEVRVGELKGFNLSTDTAKNLECFCSRFQNREGAIIWSL